MNRASHGTTAVRVWIWYMGGNHLSLYNVALQIIIQFAWERVFITNSNKNKVPMYVMISNLSLPVYLVHSSIEQLYSSISFIWVLTFIYFLIKLKYRVIQILCAHTDGCRSQPSLAYLRAITVTLLPNTLLFQFIFRIDGHAHRRTFAKRKH